MSSVTARTELMMAPKGCIGRACPVPGEPWLAVELGVSKRTARRALNALLVADGVLYSVLGKGTFVSAPSEGESSDHQMSSD
ncbi:GntR family transcriptional regulator [Nonomuraea sp. NPDC046802]|uniref:GntR family transcriptional regulator n=1 Tax=Nonomuraea sp. NPDC046802 TaxID=3154919 RepID=UPI0033C6CC01